MKNFCTIYLTRHGETDWNEKGIVQGRSDIPLNKKGRGQAKQLGNELKNINFDAAYSSYLKRAKDSAGIIAFGKNLNVVATAALGERSFGRFEGKSIVGLRKSLGETMLLPTEKQKELQFFDLESDEDVLARLIPFLKKTSKKYLGKTILMVTHGGLLRAFLHHLDFKIPDHSKNPIKNTGYLMVETDGEEFKIKEERLF